MINMKKNFEPTIPPGPGYKEYSQDMIQTPTLEEVNIAFDSVFGNAEEFNSPRYIKNKSDCQTWLRTLASGGKKSIRDIAVIIGRAVSCIPKEWKLPRDKFEEFIDLVYKDKKVRQKIKEELSSGFLIHNP